MVAVIDPDMVASMPKGLCAATGMDALTHAIEGYITKAAWELTDMLHIKAIAMIARNLRASVAGDPKAREEMAVAQYIAGMCFSNVGLGIVHSMAHPLSAMYDTPHGVACATILPYVMAYNAPVTGERYRDIAAAMGQKGTMSALRRTAAGLYTEADAHTLEEILAAKEQGTAALEALMLPVESVFTPLPLLVVEPWVEQHLYNGCPTSRYPAADGRYRVRNAAGQFLGLANINGGVLRVEKLFVERN